MEPIMKEDSKIINQTVKVPGTSKTKMSAQEITVKLKSKMKRTQKLHPITN